MKNIWNKYKREFVVLIATIAMCVVFTALNKNFLNYSNFITVLQQMVLNGILAVGMMFTIITGGIDLSVGCTYAITGIVVASCTVTYGMNPILAIIVGILIGAVLGAFNGFLINKLKLQPFIATLGTMSLYRGIAYVVTGGVPVTNVPESYRNIFNGELFAGVRSYIVVMVVVFVIAHIILSKMRSGDYLYAIGGNEEAAKLSGVFTIITGGIDLSVGCTYAITGIVVASCTVTYGMNPILAIIVGILIGAVLGAFNGFLINKLKLQPFIATLGTMSLYRGIAYVVTGGVPVTNVPESYRNIFNGELFAGVRSYIVVMVVVFVIAHIILSKMRSGDYLYAIGGNEEAAKLSGVNVIKTKYVAYIFCGICAAIAGMIMLASLGSAEATAGQAYETNAIAAAAIGGTRMAGGKGTALGTFFGALMLAVLKVGMVVINVDSFWQFVVTGIIIIVASYFEFIQQDIKGFVSRHKKTA